VSDLIDFVQEQIEYLHEKRIAEVRSRAGTLEAAPTGKCLNCAEPLAGGLRFCDADCRDDHQKLKRMKGI
jgi:hypothetical protein